MNVNLFSAQFLSHLAALKHIVVDITKHTYSGIVFLLQNEAF